MSIIVIGNGPSVLEHEYGDIIDNFDTVVRINQYRPEYRKNIGKKMDIFVTSGYNARTTLVTMPQKTQLIKETANQIIVWKDLPPKTLFDDLDKTIILEKTDNETDKIIDKTPYTEKLIKEFGFGRFLQGQWPSTGINILMYLIESGKYDKIHIYGFDGLKFGQKLHFYGNDNKTTKEHSSQKEVMFVQHYIDQGIIVRLEDSDIVH